MHTVNESLVRIQYAHFAWTADCALGLRDGRCGCVCEECGVLLADLMLSRLGAARWSELVKEAQHAESMQQR